MRRTAPLLLLAALLCTATAHAADDTQPAAPAVKPGWTELPDQVDRQPKVEKLVSEDDLTRVEELRVGGVTKKVNVHLKNSPLPDYEILISNRHYALTNSRIGDLNNGSDGPTGVRVWRLFEY